MTNIPVLKFRTWCLNQLKLCYDVLFYVLETSLVNSVMSKQHLHHYVKTSIGMV